MRRSPLTSIKTLVVRARGDDQASIAEAPLRRSTLTGPAIRVSLNRVLLRRALQLGFRDMQLLRRINRCYGGIHTACTSAWRWTRAASLARAATCLRLSSEPTPASNVPSSIERIKPTMPAPSPNGPPANGNGHGVAATQPARYGIVELIEEAEQLRGLLQDASGASLGSLGALKQQRRQSRAVQQAMASLKQLQLEP